LWDGFQGLLAIDFGRKRSNKFSHAWIFDSENFCVLFACFAKIDYSLEIWPRGKSSKYWGSKLIFSRRFIEIR
jgi:hypothetical protein